MKLIEFTKVCTKCGERKSWKHDFYAKKSNSSGKSSVCKICKKVCDEKYYIENKDKIKTRTEKYRKTKWMEDPEKARVYVNVYYTQNKDRIKIHRNTYLTKHAEKIKDSRRKYRIKNKDKIKINSRIYKIKHRKESAKWMKQKRKTNLQFKLNCNMSGAIYRSLKNGKDGKSWIDLVPYNLKQLKKHLEKQFTNKMSWQNYGKEGWTLDHKIPISVFNFTKSSHEDFQKCWALKNLQPMWAGENSSKCAKLEKHFQPSLLL